MGLKSRGCEDHNIAVYVALPDKIRALRKKGRAAEFLFSPQAQAISIFPSTSSFAHS